MPKTPLSFYLHIAAVAVIVFMLGSWMSSRAERSGADGSSATSPAKESVYSRVMRTGTIRCGYHPWPYKMIKEPNSGEMSGIYYDYIMELGRHLSLKIEWVEEIGFAEFITALKTGRIDMMCQGFWPNAQRGREIDFITPTYYDAVYAYTRIGDTRFDNNLFALNNANVKIGVIDGSPSSTIARTDFPLATAVALSQMNTGADLFSNLITGKVDAIIGDLASAQQFISNNPGKVHQVRGDALRLFQSAPVIAKNQDEFRSMINIATLEMLNSGAFEKIIQKYETAPGMFLRVAKPYSE